MTALYLEGHAFYLLPRGWRFLRSSPVARVNPSPTPAMSAGAPLVAPRRESGA